MKSATLKSVRSLIRLGKYKSKDSGGEDKQKLLKDGSSSKGGRTPQTPQGPGPGSAPESLAGSLTSLESAGESEHSFTTPERKKK